MKLWIPKEQGFTNAGQQKDMQGWGEEQEL
jgi:hypothetical protein